MEGGGEAEALPVEEEEEEEEPGAIGKLFEQAIELCSKPIGATQHAGVVLHGSLGCPAGSAPAFCLSSS